MELPNHNDKKDFLTRRRKKVIQQISKIKKQEKMDTNEKDPITGMIHC